MKLLLVLPLQDQYPDWWQLPVQREQVPFSMFIHPYLMSAQSRDLLVDRTRYKLGRSTLLKFDLIYHISTNFYYFIHFKMIQRLKLILQWSLEFVASVYVEKCMYIIQKVHLSIKVKNTSVESSFCSTCLMYY